MTNAYLCVDFFFVLSGFVIAHTYLDKVRDFKDCAEFMARRAARLYPLHLAVLAAFLAIELAKLTASLLAGASLENPPLTGTNSLEALWTNLLLIHALGVHDTLTWNGPSWSISTEFYTYLVFAVLAYATLAWGPRARLSIFAAVALIALILLSQLRAGLYVTYDLGILRCLLGFFTGAVTLLAFRRFPALPTSTLLEVVALVSTVAVIAYADVVPTTFLVPAVFASTILIFAYERGALSRLMVSQPFLLLGAWSYSIYMIHHFVGLNLILRPAGVVERLTGIELFGEAAAQNPDVTTLLAGDLLALVYLTVVVALARLTYAWIELPGQRAVLGWLSPRTLQSGAA